jgi:ribosomal-protein-alanine N-acetyltransferase
MQIRKSLVSDAGTIARLEAEIFTDAWSERDIISTISTEGGMCYTAIDDDGICAYIIARQIPPEGEIYRIAVKKEKRRHGVAYRLLSYAIKCERARGLEVLFLEVRESNTPARNFYKSFGFREIGRRKGYYKLPSEDAIIMSLSESENQL